MAICGADCICRTVLPLLTIRGRSLHGEVNIVFQLLHAFEYKMTRAVAQVHANLCLPLEDDHYGFQNNKA